MNVFLVIWYLLGPVVGIVGAILNVRLISAVIGVPKGRSEERILKIEYPETNTELESIVLFLWAYVSFLLVVSTWYLVIPGFLGLL